MKKNRLTADALTLTLILSSAGAALAAGTEELPDGYPLSQTIEDAVYLGDLKSFTATGLDEETYTIENLKDYDVTMINLWATWCGPCVAEMPDLAEFEKSVPDNVQVLTYCISYDSLDEVLSVNEDAGYEGITLIGASGDLEKVGMYAQFIPTTLFFDSEGRAVGSGKIGGQADFEAAYTEAIDSILTAMGKPAMADTKMETEE